MAYEADLVSQAFEAGQDLEDYQYYPVSINSDEEILLASDAGDFIFGVLQNTPEEGQTALVALEGITKAVGSAIIAAGAIVQVAAGGMFVTQTTGNYAGIALTPCGASGELFSLKIIRMVV